MRYILIYSFIFLKTNLFLYFTLIFMVFFLDKHKMLLHFNLLLVHYMGITNIKLIFILYITQEQFYLSI